MAQIVVQLKNDGATASYADIRGHAVVIDRPVPNGGADAGPMGGELFLASIGGCFMSTLVAAALARETAIDNATCTVVGTFAEAPRRFGDVAIAVECPTLPSEQLAHLVAVAERGCLVLNTLRGDFRLDVSARPTVDV